MKRRQFLETTARGLCGATVAGTGLAMLASGRSNAWSGALRPPGALDEDAFLGACVRCGQCVQACPYDTLELARPFTAIAAGTPYFEARQVPCEMCDDIPCQKVCPSGALSPVLQSIDDARMGLAVLLDQENCLNFQGLRCDVCYRVCPAIDKAITLETRINPRSEVHAMFLPTVHADCCTGCGKCEKSCVLDRSAIKVLPRELASGEGGGHYRWGWEEKDKAGRSLLDREIIDLPDRLPEFESL